MADRRHLNTPDYACGASPAVQVVSFTAVALYDGRTRFIRRKDKFV
jgi:hypothetical protein